MAKSVEGTASMKTKPGKPSGKQVHKGPSPALLEQRKRIAADLKEQEQQMKRKQDKQKLKKLKKGNKHQNLMVLLNKLITMMFCQYQLEKSKHEWEVPHGNCDDCRWMKTINGIECCTYNPPVILLRGNAADDGDEDLDEISISSWPIVDDDWSCSKWEFRSTRDRRFEKEVKILRDAREWAGEEVGAEVDDYALPLDRKIQ